jgi:hypothetical protein
MIKRIINFILNRKNKYVLIKGKWCKMTKEAQEYFENIEKELNK